ncbi:MAG: PAS domain S-box protein [Verrucomicrobiota bacterium]
MKRTLIRMRRVATGLTLLLTLATICASAAAGPKRVLILNPFGRDVAPFNATITAFLTTLAQELGEPLDFYEVPLDLARIAESEGEDPLVALLEGRIKNHPVDLVVPIGGAGAQFAARHRERLFPDTPVLVVAAEPRMLPPGFLQTNATLVTQKIILTGMVEDILQMQPQTTNIVLVFGASALERFWIKECRREFQSFTNRVGFTWLNDLSLDQVLNRCAALPPHSLILHGLFLMDAAGFPCEKNQALLRLHQVANAPVFGYFESEFGLGPIGGRLFQDAEIGKQGARTAIRILLGEKPENIPQLILEIGSPVYDWRELHRLDIREASQPAGSLIRFREPTFWEQYRWRIIGILLFCGLQSMLIIGLVANKLARKQADQDLRESEERLTLAAEAAEFGVWVWNITSNRIWGSETWRRLFGFASGEAICFEQLYQRVHPEDRNTMEQEIKFAAAGQMDKLREYRIMVPDGTQRWIASRGRMFSDGIGKSDRMFGAAIDITQRKQAEEKMRQLSHAMEQSPVSVVITDLHGTIVYVNQKFSEVTGYSFDECLGKNPRLLKSGESSPTTYKELWTCITSGETWRGEFHNRKKNGELYWESAVISPVRDATGKVTQYAAVKEDITERKQVEAAMHDLSQRLIRAHEAERARLGRELHDDVKQRLAVLAISAGRVDRGADKVATVETMREIHQGLVRLSEDIHALSYRLHPALLEDLGLAEALKAECERFARQESIPADVTLREMPDAIPTETALCLFRVVQEALRNVARHAKARRVEISVRPQNGGLHLVVHDDGIGFDSTRQRAHPSLGLASMREAGVSGAR